MDIPGSGRAAADLIERLILPGIFLHIVLCFPLVDTTCQVFVDSDCYSGCTLPLLLGKPTLFPRLHRTGNILLQAPVAGRYFNRWQT